MKVSDKILRMKVSGKILIILIILVSVALVAVLSWTLVEKEITQEEALKRANEIISEDYPDMSDSDVRVDTYFAENRGIYCVLYKKDVTVQTQDNESIQLSKIVIVEIDKNTGEQSISVSS